MNYWEGPARWVNTLLLVIVGFVGLDTLFQLLGALEDNLIVRFVRAIAGFFLAPFEGMFENQEFLLTAIIAVLGYSLLAGVALAAYRSVQASRRARRAGGSAGPPTPPEHGTGAASDETRRL
jgi:hypothetical protein